MSESTQPTPAPANRPTRTYAACVTEMLAHRETLVSALTAFTQELPSGSFRRDLGELTAELQRGATTEQLSSAPRMTATILPLLGIGTSPGEAGERLHLLFAESDRENKLRRQRRRVLAYPAFMAMIATTLMVFFCFMIIPVYRDIFASLDLEMAPFTLGLIKLADAVRGSPVGIPVVAIVAGVVLYFGCRTITSSSWFETALGFLSSGSSRELSAMSAFVRQVGQALAANMALSDALKIAGRCNQRPRIRRAAERLAADVALDDANALDNSPAARRLPATMIFALSRLDTGSHSDAHDTAPTVRLLEELADTYRECVRERFAWSTGIAAQLSIVMVGLLVGGLMLGLLMPLFALVDGLT